MKTEDSEQGGCLCGDTRFEILGSPMIVHACHCTRCQRRFGSALAVNLWIEEDRINLLSGTPEKHGEVVSEKGLSSEGWACAKCGFGLWTVYHAALKGSLFLRAGTLDNPAAFPPDVHIYTRSKQPWVQIPDDVPSFEAYYDFRKTWSTDSQQRFKKLKMVG
ncbi:MAG: GFA family protein [Woeseiaceae bacterium]